MIVLSLSLSLSLSLACVLAVCLGLTLLFPILSNSIIEGDLLSGRSTDWHTIGDIFRSKFFDNIINRDIPWPKIPDEMRYEAYDLIDKRVFMTLLDRYSFMFSFIFSAATTIRQLRHLEIQLEFDALKPFILL
ncbi:uncharacterized protein LOC114295552 isoform X3 [Camellia sinensis]|uniref:uncharacterized protein LOC114295552 isoform X3 n=1 Tax=Camellia sinensis TaxID=4442 RepID=UPI001035F13C|nr:uncharacterized protein LOC114295552 isoform X3 [Camellia sinensis]